MRIHALSTGTVRVKRAFLVASRGWRRQVDLFLPGAWSNPLPIHCWAVEHAGRLLLVDTGHTPGHISVVCIDDDGHHVLLAGDATDTEEQLRAIRPDAIAPKPAVSITTMQAILAHAREHPTVYLPSHDPESIPGLEAGTTL